MQFDRTKICFIAKWRKSLDDDLRHFAVFPLFYQQTLNNVI
jgi:hypothetical protein